MKKIAILLISIILFSCSKKEDSPAPAPSSAGAPASLINLWELEKGVYLYSENGTLSSSDTNIVPPNDMWLQLRSDNTYSEYYGGSLSESGTYTHTGTELNFFLEIDSITYTITSLSTTKLILYNIQQEISFGDTTTNETELTFHKL